MLARVASEFADARHIDSIICGEGGYDCEAEGIGGRTVCIDSAGGHEHFRSSLLHESRNGDTFFDTHTMKVINTSSLCHIFMFSASQMFN